MKQHYLNVDEGTCLDEKQVLESLYHGCDITKIPVDESVIISYNEHKFDLSLPDISSSPTFSGEYFMPEEYLKIDLEKYLLNKCRNDEERNRVKDELELFVYSGKTDFVKYLIYLVDQMTKNNIVWGVGRGSSVSVFIYYLIGIHKVNSVKYGLEFTDYFKLKE